MDADAMNMSLPEGGDLLSMADTGKAALENGLISKKEAKATQRKLGIDTPKKTLDFLQSYLGIGQSDPYFASSGTATPPATADTPTAAGLKNMQTKNSKTAQSTNSTSKTRIALPDEDQLTQFLNMARGIPEVQGQQQGLDSLLNMQQKLQAQSDPHDEWVKPLLALSDSYGGGHQAASFKSGSEKRQENLDKFANEIQQRRGDLSKLILDSMTKLKVGSDQTSAQNKSSTNVFVGTGMPNGVNARLARIPIQAGADFDKQLANSTQSVESLNRGQRFLDDPSLILTPVRLNQVMQDVSNSIAKGGTATDMKLAMDVQQIFAGAIHNAEIKYGAKITDKDDMRKIAPTIVADLRNGLLALREEYSDNIHRQADQIYATHSSSFGSVPNLEETVNAKIAEIEKRFPRSKNFSATGLYTAPAAGGKDYHSMTDAELDAELKKRGAK